MIYVYTSKYYFCRRWGTAVVKNFQERRGQVVWQHYYSVLCVCARGGNWKKKSKPYSSFKAVDRITQNRADYSYCKLTLLKCIGEHAHTLARGWCMILERPSAWSWAGSVMWWARLWTRDEYLLFLFLFFVILPGKNDQYLLFSADPGPVVLLVGDFARQEEQLLC